MKNTVAKYFVICGITIFLGMSEVMSLKNNVPPTLRVAFPNLKSADSYDPAKIYFSYDYLFLENIFSPLVEIDPHGGEVRPAVANKFEWIGDDLHLTIRTDLKTASGIVITPDDVMFSLKRLLVLSGNTHGNFKDLVCDGVDLKSVEQDCPGIGLQGNIVILKAGKRKSFLLPMLAMIDFAIIPRTSADPKTLKITNYHETSGPYYVEHDFKNETTELRLNPHHFHAAKNIAPIVQLLKTDMNNKEAALDAFKQNKVDHLMTANASKSEDVLAYVQNHSDAQAHATQKIQNLALVFTERGQRELSAEERRQIGLQVRAAFEEIYQGKLGYESSNEFFHSLADGGLTKDQERHLSQLRPAMNSSFDKKFRVGFLKSGDLMPWKDPVKKRLPQADIYLEKNIPDLEYGSISDMPHAFITGTDSSFLEDIGLISYSLNTGFFGMTKKERKNWLANYMELEDKRSRMAALRDLHYQALASPALVPLMVSPFVALIRKPWKMELSELYANNQLWLIKYQ